MSGLIVALDFNDEVTALALVDKLDPTQCALKVGSELFTRAGAPFIRLLMAQQFKVFLDLKFHDIPNTVAKACVVSADLGVWMLTVHAAGGSAMLMAAQQALLPYGATRPLLMAVTVLTSMAEADLSSVGINKPLLKQVCDLACLAQAAGVDGVVSSAIEVPMIKAVCGSTFLTITPGIRLPDDPSDDQSRLVTPAFARAAGSDYLVMGRSITRAADPAAVIQQICRHV